MMIRGRRGCWYLRGGVAFRPPEESRPSGLHSVASHTEYHHEELSCQTPNEKMRKGMQMLEERGNLDVMSIFHHQRRIKEEQEIPRCNAKVMTGKTVRNVTGKSLAGSDSV